MAGADALRDPLISSHTHNIIAAYIGVCTSVLAIQYQPCQTIRPGVGRCGDLRLKRVPRYDLQAPRVPLDTPRVDADFGQWIHSKQTTISFPRMRVSLTFQGRPLIAPYSLPFTSFVTHLIRALPLLKHTLPPSTLVANLTSSQPSFFSPVLHISVISLSAGFTGLANLAWNSLILAGSLPPSSLSKP
jgi:hypothetical protein